MAKQSSIEKNNRRRRLVAKFAAKRAALKKLVRDRELPAEDRMRAVQALATLPRNGAKVRIRNRCSMTGRARGNYRKFGVSRIKLRELASKGQVPGVVKSSW
jgi:small subunit ribosomal protein S14